MNISQDKLRKKRTCKPREDDQRNEFDKFPHHIVLDIVSRLPITSVMQSRFVCRSWHNCSLDQNLASLHFSKVVNCNPFLIFHSDDPIQNELSFAEIPGSDDDGKGMVKKFSIPFSVSMAKFNVVGSCNGLLCLCDYLYKDAVYIYNPFTRDYKELPRTRQYEEEIVVCGFGYLPRTNEYKVVKIVHQRILNNGIDHYGQRIRMLRKCISEVFVFTLGGNNTWRNVGIAPHCLERRSQEALCTNGRIHWLTLGVKNNVHGLIIISFDLVEENFYEIPRPDFNVIDGCNYHLAILRGCLSAVVFGQGLRRDLEIWVMKEYNVKESWIKQFKIRAYVPESPFRKLPRPVLIWKNSIIRATLRVLCILESDEILIEYRLGKFAVYDPHGERYKGMTFKGMPNMPQTVVHMGSLTQRGNAWKDAGLAAYSIDWRSQQALNTNGRLHWLSFGKFNNVRGLIIISFHLADEKFYEVPRPHFSAIDGRGYHLAILRGCLSAAVFEHGLCRDLEIWVMKDYNVKESRIKEFKFKGYVPESPWDKFSQPVQKPWNKFGKARLTLGVLCTLENGGILIEYET